VAYKRVGSGLQVCTLWLTTGVIPGLHRAFNSCRQMPEISRRLSGGDIQGVLAVVAPVGIQLFSQYQMRRSFRQRFLFAVEPPFQLQDALRPALG
jgi:hypothetical protein